MSQTQQRPQPKVASSQAAVRAELQATAQYLSFDPGLYAVDFSTPQSSGTDVGLRLPCLRLEPVPPSPLQKGRAFISVLAEGGWIWKGDEPTFVLVVGSQAGIVLTIYRASDGMAVPQVRIRNIGGQAVSPTHPMGIPPAKPGTAAAQPPRERPPAATPAAPSAGAEQASLAVPLSHLVHVRGVGDVKTTGTDWTGTPGSGAPIEGFAIMPIGMIGPESIEYQAVLGHNWNTPWFSGGEFCGSRGLALELLGFRVRLTGDAAETYECSVWGSFVGKPEVGPVLNGDVCEADGAALEAMRVVISPKRDASASPTDGEPDDGAAELAGPFPLDKPRRPRAARRSGSADS